MLTPSAGTTGLRPPARERRRRFDRRRGRARSSAGAEAWESTSDPRPATPPGRHLRSPTPPPLARRRIQPRPAPAGANRPTARSLGLLVRRQERAPLGDPRVDVGIEHPQHGVLAGDRPHLAHRLGQAPAPALTCLLVERRLIAR